MRPPTSSPRRGRTLAKVLVVVALATGALVRPAMAHVRAATLLARFGAGDEAEAARAVEEVKLDAPPGEAGSRARLYVPRGVTAPPGIVLVHGVHRLGIDEPRLVRFARALAESGVLVLTPEIRELADYHVDPRSIATIGGAARALRDRSGRAVGVMGMSFAGGLSLLAAADPRYAPDVAFVVAIGAHDDLGRVSHFFATGTIARPDGSTNVMRAHDYGPLVLVYSHVEDFFDTADVPSASAALRAWLWEDRTTARADEATLSPAGRAKMDLLFGEHVDAIAGELLAVIARNDAQMGPVSPHGHLDALRVPVFLLHGAGDSVIPATETSWLARDVPPALVRDVLVSPALVHVELDKGPSIADRWALVHFMSDVLEASRQTAAR